jgi:hypothetical protein
MRSNMGEGDARLLVTGKCATIYTIRVWIGMTIATMRNYRSVWNRTTLA